MIIQCDKDRIIDTSHVFMYRIVPSDDTLGFSLVAYCGASDKKAVIASSSDKKRLEKLLSDIGCMVGIGRNLFRVEDWGQKEKSDGNIIQ